MKQIQYGQTNKIIEFEDMHHIQPEEGYDFSLYTIDLLNSSGKWISLGTITSGTPIFYDNVHVELILSRREDELK